MKFRPSAFSSSLHYALHLGQPEHEAVIGTFARYGAMMNVLEELAAREGIKSDVVRLQKLAYEQIRSETQLPAQMVLLGIRDFAARQLRR
jgi:hypothetical protein